MHLYNQLLFTKKNERKYSWWPESSLTLKTPIFEKARLSLSLFVEFSDER